MLLGMEGDLGRQIGEVPHVTIVNSTLLEHFQLTVYPNPLNGAMLLRSTSEMPAGTMWKWYDFSGKQIGAGTMNGNEAAIGAYLKNTGLYHIELSGRNGQSLGGATIQN
jgi:hypothetical protein